MKKHIFKFIAILSILAFSTCNEDYLEVENKNNLTVDNWYSTAEDFQMALNSCYGALMDAGMFGQNFHLRFGVFSDRVLFETTGLDRLIIFTTDDWVRNIWRGIYFGLFRTSKLIREAKEKGADGIENMSEDMYNNILAQAKSLRAAYYFYLTVIWHKPIFYTEENIPEDFLLNLTNGEPIQFWEQIEKDITEAIPHLKLKSELSESEYGRVTKGGPDHSWAKQCCISIIIITVKMEIKDRARI